MPKKPTKAAAVELEDEDETTAKETEEKVEDNDVEAMLAEQDAPNEIRVTVYKLSGPQRRKEWLFSTDAADFTRERLRDEFGGGDFYIYAKRGRDLVFSRAVLIAPPRTPKEQPAQQAAPVVDVLVQALSGIREMVAQVVARPQETEEAFLRKMQLYKTILASPEREHQSGGGGIEAFTAFQKGIEFMKAMGTDASEKSATDVMLEAVKSFGQPLANIIGNAAARERAARTKAPAPPSKSAPQLGAPSATPVPAPTDEKGNDVQAMLKMQLNWLCDLARDEADPRLYAELILDQVDPDELRAFLSHDPEAKCIALAPRVADHRPWFQELLSHVTAGLSADDGQDAPSGSDANIPR